MQRAGSLRGACCSGPPAAGVVAWRAGARRGRRGLQCRCDLVKPDARLQRLFNSRALAAAGAGEAAAAALLPQSEAELAEHMRELRLLLQLLPPHLRQPLSSRPDFSQLVEVVLDLGRPPVARFPSGDARLSEQPLRQADLGAAVQQVGDFGDDNRAGIDRTLHRISCLRNRDGAIVGLTCRAGRAVSGCAALAADLAVAGKSILIMGRPGVGKTTAVRELSRLLSDEQQKRVVVVDTSNEIGGDGDIPHAGVGRARRMQVPCTEQQQRVMIEAVENHMPEVIVIDEIGTEAEALAARTISQRGVQLVATAHGGHLENLLKNPSLLDLVGGIQSVTLGDDEARRRGSRKTTRERAAPPTFDVAIELLDRRRWRVYLDVAAAVDRLLLGKEAAAEIREQTATGEVLRLPEAWDEADDAPHPSPYARTELLPPSHPARWQAGRAAAAASPERDQPAPTPAPEPEAAADAPPPLLVFLVGLHAARVQEALELLGAKGQRLVFTTQLEGSDVVLGLRAEMKRGSWARVTAKAAGIPVYALKVGRVSHLLKALETVLGLQPSPGGVFDGAGSGSDGEEQPTQWQNHVVSMTVSHNEAEALAEVREAVEKVVLPSGRPIELLPRSEEIVGKQAALTEAAFGLGSERLRRGTAFRLRILPSRLVAAPVAQ